MTLLTIAKAVSKEIGMDVPTVLAASTEREHIELLAYINSVGQNIARRVDWRELHELVTVTGTGAAAQLTLPSEFSRLIKGAAVAVGSVPVRGGLTPDEWNVLTQIQGTPRYYLIEGKKISFFPYLALAATATVHYQTVNWVSGDAAEMTSDTQTALFPESLLVKGAIAWWRMQKGMEFTAYQEDFEANLADLAGFNAGERSP